VRLELARLLVLKEVAVEMPPAEFDRPNIGFGFANRLPIMYRVRYGSDPVKADRRED